MKPIVFIIALLLFLPFFSVHAQSLTASERAQLEAQLAQVLAEEQQAQADLKNAQSQSASLQRDINIITAKIKTEQLNIQAKNLLIKTLGDNITVKKKEIKTLEERIVAGKQSIAGMFRGLNKIDDYSLLEILLSKNTVSEFFQDSESLQLLQQKLRELAVELSALEASTTVAKDTLVKKQSAEIDARYAIQQIQKTLQADQAKQKQLLSMSKSSEKAYQTLLAEKKKIADQISARLFALAGGSNPIPFGQAYQFAVAAYQKTNVDPAFLLAVLTQESNLGNNQGTCYLSNTVTGSGISVKSGKAIEKVMSPTRDVPSFVAITKAINADAFNTVVSCPQSIGWGGAMGPAQFIASTWMLFADRVEKALGINWMANPWNPEHAFMASAIYLSDLGASKGGYTAQKNAACRYYSGSSCSKSSLVSSYGNSVMALASSIQQTEINKLLGI